MKRSFSFVLFSVCKAVAILQGQFAYAQTSQFRVIEANSAGSRIEVTFSWQETVSTALEKAKSAKPNLNLVQALNALTDGVNSASESIALNDVVMPQVQIISAEFDEVSFGTNEAVPQVLSQNLAQISKMGYERKKPTATLNVRAIGYDADTKMLRRYRKVVVEITYGKSNLQKTLSPPNPHLLVANSVFSSGKWFRIPITEEGIYKIDAAYLQSLGVNSTDFTKLQIYGNGGQMLPAKNNTSRIPDLQSNSVWAAADGLYFYAKAPSGWKYNHLSKTWEHYINLFSSENAVFLKADEAATNVVKNATAPSATTFAPFSSTQGRWFLEEDRENLSEGSYEEEGSGLDWFGRTFSPTITQTVLDQTFDGLTNGNVQYRARVAVRSNPSVNVRFEANGTILANYVAREVDYFDLQGEEASTEILSFANVATANAKQTIQLKMGSGANDPKGWLDWVEAVYPQSLTATNNFLRLATPITHNGGGMELTLSGFSGAPQVWDITNPNAIVQLSATESGGTYRVRLVVDANAPHEIVVFVPTSSAIKKPSVGKAVTNQNLHGIKTLPELVIVAPTEFKVQADEWANYRRGQGMTVEVVDINHIFNEFSGGVVDMRAMRDYFKFLYDKDSKTDPKFRYVLLLGDGTYDYRGIVKGANKNWLPVYETDETLSKIVTYTSDDYFALLDDEEGEWAWVAGANSAVERMDIGIGRIPAQSATEVSDVFKKLKIYENPSNFGAWRTRYSWVADDQYPRNEADLHTQNADYIARFVKTLAPELNMHKVYAISYPSQITVGGRRVPEARAEIMRSFNDGTLVWNYSGHGGWNALADEGLFVIDDIQNLQNINTLPILVTATCSFGHWDFANRQSGAELAIMNPKGGGIAVLTTVRIVYTSSNTFILNPGLNRQLNNYLVTRDEKGLPRRLGDALRLTKNTEAGSEDNNRKFNLLGDPSMRIGLPTQQAVVEKINGQTATKDIPLRALEKMTLEGRVETTSGVTDATFNGSIDVTVFDVVRYVNLPVDEAQNISDGRYETQNDLIYRGRVDVKQGKWAMNFVVPKDISYANRNGKIAMYAFSNKTDAIGSSEKVLIGGTATNAIIDTKPPIVRAFLNDTTFVSGGLTTKTPELILKLSDDNGLNTVGTGVGHELLLVIDNDERNAIDLGARYKAAPNSYQKGEVRYVLPEQSNGSHTLKIKAWDIANNSATATLDYEVSAENALSMRNVYNYPNPTRGETKFVFEHNQPNGTEAKIVIKIYTINGRLIKVIPPDEALPSHALNANFAQIRWDGRDDDGDVLATGTYLYKVRLEVPSEDNKSSQVVEKIEKLVIIR